MKKDKIEEAKKILEEENKKKTKECSKKIEEVLVEYNCGLAIAPNIIINGQTPQIIINIKEEKNAQPKA